jgi:predicted RNA-binding Zn-ribbon protein involved in translation (DUF1610 family)
MNSRCPRCSAEIIEISTFRSGTAYCKTCGWNLGDAGRKLRQHLLVSKLLSVIGVILAGIAWIWGSRGFSGAAMIACAFSLFPAAMAFIAKHGSSQLEATEREAAAGTLRLPATTSSWRMGDPSQVWAEYYRLRNWARLSLVGFPVALYLVVQTPEPLLLRLNALPETSLIAVIFVFLGAGAVVFSIPLLRWIEWRCPRCGEKFAAPRANFGLFTLVFVLWGLAFGSRCGGCKLECGASEIRVTS